MAFSRKMWDFGKSREYEYNFKGNYGARGEKRAPRRKRTSEEIAKQNQRNKVKNLRRKIKLNFEEGDLWVCLKYPKGTRKYIKDVKADVKAFCGLMREAYKRRDLPFKFIYRMEVGRLGGIHIHFIINRIPGEETGLTIRDCWKAGSVNIQYLYEKGDYEQLADYITKEAGSDDGQMVLPGIGMEEKKAFLRYSCSRNLKRPKDIVQEKEYSHRTMRKMITEGPEPSEGYYIDPGSVRKGINPYTGYSYLYYTEFLIEHPGNVNFTRYERMRKNIRARKHGNVKNGNAREA